MALEERKWTNDSAKVIRGLKHPEMLRFFAQGKHIPDLTSEVCRSVSTLFGSPDHVKHDIVKRNDANKLTRLEERLGFR